MRLFRLVRNDDPSGISGTGIVAEGVQFTDGTVVLRWRPLEDGQKTSTAIWPDAESMLVIHGHNGATEIEWVD